MKLLLSAVMFSPNIGDGVIAECVRAAAPEPYDIDMLDLAGRREYTDRPNPIRSRILSWLAALPTPVADVISKQLVTAQIQRHLMPQLPEKLAGLHGVLIGGGQLFADANLNFPLKINRLVAEISARDLPFGIHAVGVSASWTPAAQKLFGAVLTHPNLRFLSVRDAQSRDNLTAHFTALGVTDVTRPQVFPDPGFLSGSLLKTAALPPPDPLRRHVGFGITHPTALALHGDTRAAQNWPLWYANTARALVDAGHRVTLFTNGAFEDEDCLTRTNALLQDIDPQDLTRAPRPARPHQLVDLIAGFDHVISHRLHAGIVAYSCGIAPVGLPWDRKLDGFFDLIGLPENLMHQVQPTSAEIIANISDTPIDPVRQSRILDDARAGIAAAVAAFAAPF